MAVCQICGKQYGMFGGGTEPYTGRCLNVCNNCEGLLRDIENNRTSNPSKCNQICESLIYSCNDKNVVALIQEFSGAGYDKMKELKEEAALRKQQEEQRQKQLLELEIKYKEAVKEFKLTTGYNFEGYKISEYKGIVSGEVVLGTGFLSEFSVSVSDTFGVQSNVFAEKMMLAKQAAQKNLIKNAMLTGANALIGVDFDYITFSNNILGVSANGTAVVIEKIEE